VQVRDARGAEPAAIAAVVDLAGMRVLELRDRVRFGVHDAEALDVERHRFDLALGGWSL